MIAKGPILELELYAVIEGLYNGYMGIMEKKMAIIIWDLGV